MLSNTLWLDPYYQVSNDIQISRNLYFFNTLTSQEYKVRKLITEGKL